MNRRSSHTIMRRLGSFYDCEAGETSRGNPVTDHKVATRLADARNDLKKELRMRREAVLELMCLTTWC
jgi:hypothetical protein